ncbi:MAG: hypothetical protein KBH45_09180, partial [Verrucomicrobia bacterium]|nr:hypothetical protein [Verrucomicrobiota bacterium]
MNLFTPHIGIAAEKNHFEVLPGLPLMACATTKLNEAFMLVARTITVKPQKLRVCFFAPPLANRPFDTDKLRTLMKRLTHFSRFTFPLAGCCWLALGFTVAGNATEQPPLGP